VDTAVRAIADVHEQLRHVASALLVRCPELILEAEQRFGDVENGFEYVKHVHSELWGLAFSRVGIPLRNGN
jgi:hypothetical protein